MIIFKNNEVKMIGELDLNDFYSIFMYVKINKKWAKVYKMFDSLTLKDLKEIKQNFNRKREV